MRLIRLLLALILSLSCLTMFFGCAEPAPAPPPVVVAPPQPPPPPTPVYFVNVSSLALRQGPTTAAPQISTLNFNEEVELMGTSDGWGRVRVLGRGLEGWASLKYLSPAPADRPRPTSVPRRRPPAEQGPKPSEVPKAM